MAKSDCIDKSINAILAGWRYDISGIFPEMRRDYESHLASCAHCRSRQRFHRRLDVALAAATCLLAALSALALGLLHHFHPMAAVQVRVLGRGVGSGYGALVAAAAAGEALSLLALALVLTSTPVPSHLGDLAAERLRLIEDSLPESIKALRPW